MILGVSACPPRPPIGKSLDKSIAYPVDNYIKPVDNYVDNYAKPLKYMDILWLYKGIMLPNL
jgi:hypothetical protein